MFLNFLESHKKGIKCVGCKGCIFDYLYLFQAAYALGYFARFKNVTENFIDKDVLLDKTKSSLCYLYETLNSKTFEAHRVLQKKINPNSKFYISNIKKTIGILRASLYLSTFYVILVKFSIEIDRNCRSSRFSNICCKTFA